MRPIVWTDAHKREALRRTYEIAAEVCEEDASQAATLVNEAVYFARAEGLWRNSLLISNLTHRIDSEVRRVDGLATGRLVRETTYDVVTPREIHEERRATVQEARDAARVYGQGYRAVRVTRIRRAR